MLPFFSAIEGVVYDYVIIGGGIVGLSTAWQLQRRKPNSSILLIEKENRFAAHQSGRNSGVIHAGIYYPPGSLKARFCKAGVSATVAFCTENNTPFEQCGKLLVATNEIERQRMLTLFERAQENGLDVELLDAEELRRLEPNINGEGAIFLRTTGIVDYAMICSRLAEKFQNLGGDTRLNCEVIAIDESSDRLSVTLQTGEVIDTTFLITCAGLMADRLARMQNIDIDFRVIPFRGEYYRLRPELNDIVRHLIYPIPDPELPFLGIHLTRMIDGSVTVGPNALLGWKREGYGRFNISLRDSWEIVSFSGFWHLLRVNFGNGLREMWNSLWRRGYLSRIQRYCPSLTSKDFLPYRTGVRAIAIKGDGTMVDDFLFAESSRSIHVCSAPSPAATAALPIGAHICDKVDAAQLATRT